MAGTQTGDETSSHETSGDETSGDETSGTDDNNLVWGLASAEVLELVRGYLNDVSRRTHDRLGKTTGVAGVAVTTAVAGGAPLTAGSSTALAAQVDRVQFDIGHGPCLRALGGGGEAYVPDLARDDRWGRYGPAAAGLGVRSCLSVPVHDGAGAVLGVVKVYSHHVDGLDASQRQLGHDSGLEIAAGLGLVSTLLVTSAELGDRVDAMDSRHSIDLATGVLMGRLGCSAESAFDLLRAQSQNHNIRLRDVALSLLLEHGPDRVDVADDTDGDVIRAPFSRRGQRPGAGR